jgi:hypothetical protein
MAGFRPAIHDFAAAPAVNSWMAAKNPNSFHSGGRRLACGLASIFNTEFSEFIELTELSSQNGAAGTPVFRVATRLDAVAQQCDVDRAEGARNPSL